MKAWFRRRWPHVVIGLFVVASGPLWAGYVFLYVVYLWNISYSSAITQRIATTDKFEIFRDLLVILIPIATGLAALTYSLIRREASEREKRHKEEFDKRLEEYREYLSTQSEAFLSYNKWKEYHRRWMDSEGTSLLQDDGDLQEAIYWAEAAFKRVERLDKKGRAEIILDTYNLLAYLLAIRRAGDDQARAVKYAMYIFDNRSKYPDSKDTYAETYWWVILLCSDRSTREGQTDYQNAVEAIHKILANTHYDCQWRTDLRKKYTKLFPANNWS